MAGNAANGGRSRARVMAQSAAALALLLPLIAIPFTDEVDWTASDFVLAGALLGGTGLLGELAARRTGDIAYRTAAGVALVAALLLVWMSLAVGLIGAEDDPANLMYAGVLAVGGAGVLVARFRPRGMAWAMLATALAQAAVAVIALAAGLGAAGPIWPWEIVILNGFFAALWAGSALLFRIASDGRSDRRAGRRETS